MKSNQKFKINKMLIMDFWEFFLYLLLLLFFCIGDLKLKLNRRFIPDIQFWIFHIKKLKASQKMKKIKKHITEWNFDKITN